jgi:hypothetical protein
LEKMLMFADCTRSGRSAALVASLVMLALLTSCGGRLDDALDSLLNRSRLFSATVTPNPVPQPMQGSSTPFVLRVNFESNNTIDVIRVSLENPAGSGNYVLIGRPDACSAAAGGSCGSAWIAIECLTYLTAFGSSYRAVTCGGGADATTVLAGNVKLKAEIIGRGVFGGYVTAEADDEITLSLGVQ